MFEDPVLELKRQLAKAILETIEYQWYRYEGLIALDQPRISNLERGRLDRFSVQKLVRVLGLLNRRVEIKVVAVGPVPTVPELRRIRDRKDKRRLGGM